MILVVHVRNNGCENDDEEREKLLKKYPQMFEIEVFKDNYYEEVEKVKRAAIELLYMLDVTNLGDEIYTDITLAVDSDYSDTDCNTVRTIYIEDCEI